jgi:transcription antitermination factor NusG
MAEMNEDPWFVLHVLANHEKRVARHLDMFAVEHYVPQYAERSRWSDRTVTLERPLFMGYVFARFQSEGRRLVQSAPGVLKILGKDTLDMVSNTEIERIRRALTSGYALRPHNQIAAGKPVRVCRGIFAGAEGVVAELRRNCNVVLRLSGIDQYFSLEISQDDIELLQDTKARAVKQPAVSRDSSYRSRNSRIA